MNHTTSMQELIRLLPHWHYKVERSIRRQQKSRQISYETDDAEKLRTNENGRARKGNASQQAAGYPHDRQSASLWSCGTK